MQRLWRFNSRFPCGEHPGKAANIYPFTRTTKAARLGKFQFTLPHGEHKKWFKQGQCTLYVSIHALRMGSTGQNAERILFFILFEIVTKVGFIHAPVWGASYQTHSN